MVRKPFSIINTPLPWPLDPKINRAHPWLVGRKCMKFHRWMTIFNHPYPTTFTIDLLTSKSIGHILDSWGSKLWSFITIIVYLSQKVSDLQSEEPSFGTQLKISVALPSVKKHLWRISCTSSFLPTCPRWPCPASTRDTAATMNIQNKARTAILIVPSL